MQMMNKQSGSMNQVIGTSKQSLPHNRQQQNARHPSAVNGSLAKGLTISDEFKNGFPSDGLLVASNKWWGSKPADEAETKEDSEHKADDVAADVKPEGDNGSSNVDSSGASLLTAIRRSAAAEGREALELGVFKGRSLHDIGDSERTLLLGLFHSALPEEWTEKSL